MAQRTGRVLVLAATLSVLIAPVASAAVRYAASGGTGADPCANPAKPCSVLIAADMSAPGTTIQAGDLVELAPGIYHADDEGEFGELGSIRPPEGVTVRGQPGKARPVIVTRAATTVGETFSVGPGVEVADVEIRNQSGQGTAINVWGGTLNRVIARSNTPDDTCNFSGGVIRSSACLNSGGGSAIGVNVATKGILTGVIRNSTLIATGPGSVGMDLIYQAFKRGLSANIDAVGVVARGEEKDVIAKAWALNKGRGADVSIELRSSDYATVETEAEHGGTVSVTRPGTNGNITALPLLAKGNLFQLPGSPTIDKGAVDAASGSFDADGEARTIGAAPDIGADELGSAALRADPIPDTQLAFLRGEGEGLDPTWTPVRVVSLAFGSSELGSHFECKLDRGPYRACSSPYEKRVGVGRHRFQVRAVDPEGQVDRTPATLHWRVLSRREFLRWVRNVEAQNERAAPAAGAARRWPAGRS
jgi:hypothetical protein